MDENKIAKNIIDAAERLTKLQVKTIVGEFKIDNNETKLTPVEGESDSIYSIIDLLSGDVQTAMSQKFLEEPYKSLREYHHMREQQGHDIIDGNIRALKSLIGLIKEAIENKGGEAE